MSESADWSRVALTGSQACPHFPCNCSVFKNQYYYYIKSK